MRSFLKVLAWIIAIAAAAALLVAVGAYVAASLP